MSPEEKAKADEIYKAIIGKERNSLVNRYGKDAEKVAKGRAIKQAQKLAEKKMNSSKDKLREMVKNALTVSEKKKPFPDLTGDGKITKADILKGRGVELKEVNAVAVLKDYGVDDEIIKDFIKTHKDDIVGMDADQIKMEFDNFRDVNYDYIDEDLDLGHEDNEPHMLKGDLYRIGKYAMELYQMVDEFEGQGEVDFPHWWQAKIINAREAIESAKHYLDFETKEPQIDAMVGAIDMSGALDNIGVEDEIEEGIHDRDITSAPHTNVKGKMGDYDPAKRAASLKRLANFGPKKEDDKVDEKKLTKPELKKREEIAKAMEKGDPGMDKEKKMAIATSIAKRVAERLKAKK